MEACKDKQWLVNALFTDWLTASLMGAFRTGNVKYLSMEELIHITACVNAEVNSEKAKMGALTHNEMKKLEGAIEALKDKAVQIESWIDSVREERENEL